MRAGTKRKRSRCGPELATRQDLADMEKRLLKAIRSASLIDLAPLTAKLKAGTDSLEAAVKKNQPKRES